VAADTGGGILGIFTTPVWALVWIVLYFDIRVRLEGFDVQVLLEEATRRIAQDS